MTRLLEILGDVPGQEFEPGTLLIEEGKPLDQLYVLREGEVEITRGGVEICKISTSGSTFGEMSALLDTEPSASVKVSQPSNLLVIENPKAFLSENNGAALEIAKLLAYRVNWITLNFAQAKEAPTAAEIAAAMHDDSFAKRIFSLERRL